MGSFRTSRVSFFRSEGVEFHLPGASLRPGLMGLTGNFTVMSSSSVAVPETVTACRLQHHIIAKNFYT